MAPFKCAPGGGAEHIRLNETACTERAHNTLFSNAVSACNRVQTVTFVVGHTASIFERQMIVVIHKSNPIFKISLLGHPQLCVN